MKRIKALIALISVCLTLSFTFVSGVVSASATPGEMPISFASFRLYSYYSLSDDAIPFQFSHAGYFGANIRLCLKSGENKIVLGEETQESDRIRCHQIKGDIFIGSVMYEYDIPMEFFEDDSGVFEVVFEYLDSDGEFHERQGYPFDFLRNVAYSKSDGKIYFTLQKTER